MSCGLWNEYPAVSARDSFARSVCFSEQISSDIGAVVRVWLDGVDISTSCGSAIMRDFAKAMPAPIRMCSTVGRVLLPHF